MKNLETSSSPKKKHFILSAGIIPVYLVDSQPRYLLLRAYNFWDFPKGVVEKSESPLEAARRELLEETGIARVQFNWGVIFRETEPYGHGKIARYYLGQVWSQQVILSSASRRPEHNEFRWVTESEGSALLVPRLQKILDWAHGIATTPGENS